MRFSFGVTDYEDRKHAILMAGVTLLSAPVAGITMLIPTSHRPIDIYAWLSVVSVAPVLSYVGLKIHNAKTKGTIRIRPSVALAMCCSTSLTVGLVSAGEGHGAGIYEMLFVVAAVYAGIVGDNVFRAIWWLFTIPVMAWSMWVEGLSGNSYAVSLAFYGLASACALAITSVTISGLARWATSRRALSILAEQARKATSLEEGLDRCLPLVASVLPTDHVIALLRKDGRRDFTAIKAWPSNSPLDDDVAVGDDFLKSVTANQSVMGKDHFFLPIGYSGNGDLMLSASRKDSGFSRRYSTPLLKQMADSVASNFLRMTARLSFAVGGAELATSDPMTGLANAKGLVERFKVESVRALRTRMPLSLAIIDFDNFKRYNELQGQLAGDIVIRSFAAVVSSRIRTQDYLARTGGQEFTLLLPDADLPSSERLIDELRSLAPKWSTSGTVLFSAGATTWDGVEDLEAVIERAYASLKLAKMSGRNRTLVAQVEHF